MPPRKDCLTLMNNTDKQTNRAYLPAQEELLHKIDRHISDPHTREELKQSLQELTNFKFALDESSIVAITDHKGKIEYVNDTFCKISQYSQEELLGKDHRLINSGHHNKKFMQHLWQTISSGKVWHGEIKNKAKDGSFYWVNTTIVPFIGKNGTPEQYLAIRNEVTELKRVEEELKVMMNKVIHIQEEERKRFSRELHDGIGQSLFSLLIQLDQMINNHTHIELEKLRQEVSFIMEDVRKLAWELRPSVLDDLGVVPAVRKYIQNYSDYYGIEVRFECQLKRRLDVQVETAMYRIIQESLTNIAKYAQAVEASVAIDDLEGEVQITISDQGKGFVRDNDTKGTGLFSMEERAKSIGGEAEINSKPGKGTTIKVTIPNN